jgi:cytochrome c biogenesis protein CcdA
MAIIDTSGLYLPFIFAFGTGLPVIFFAYILAFSVGKMSNYFNKVQRLELIVRYFIGSVFIVVGCYYLIMFFV